MKNKILSRLSAALTVFFCLAAGSGLRAQIANPYKVINNLPCPVTITYTISKPIVGCVPCAAGSISIPGSSLANIVLPAGCIPACDIAITLTTVGSIGVSPITVKMAIPTNSGACADCTPCSIYNLNWTPGQTKIQ